MITQQWSMHRLDIQNRISDGQSKSFDYDELNDMLHIRNGVAEISCCQMAKGRIQIVKVLFSIRLEKSRVSRKITGNAIFASVNYLKHMFRHSTRSFLRSPNARLANEFCIWNRIEIEIGAKVNPILVLWITLEFTFKDYRYYSMQLHFIMDEFWFMCLSL